MNKNCKVLELKSFSDTSGTPERKKKKKIKSLNVRIDPQITKQYK